MKKFIYTATLALGLLATSCSDQFLEDKKQYGVFNDDTFENEAQTGWFIDRLYYDFYSGYKGPGQNIVGLWEDRTALTEEKGGISDMIDPSKELDKSDDCSNYYGTAPATNVQNNPYTRIRNCNFIINNIDEVGVNISDSFKKTAKGQMYFLRGMQYFDLMRMYGGVPIVLEVENAEVENPSIKHPRASVSEVVKQILSDLDNAANMLPDKWGDADRGRFTRAAALAMKSRVLLMYASPLFNKDWDNTANQRWADALSVSLTAETELTSAGYGLYGNTAKEWNDMFIMDHGKNFCKEVIMVRLLSAGTTNTSENNGWENGIRLSSQGGGGGLTAPKEMIDLFPMKDGSRPTVANGYDEFKFFLDRDPRFYRTFAFSGCKWGYKGAADDVVWAYRWEYQTQEGTNYSYSDNNNVASPVFVRKMSDTSVDNTFKYSGTDILEYRYAELILNIAECYAATGNTAKCLEYLEKIRSRVGVLADNHYGLGTFADKYAALEACLYERRIELAYEGKRFLDIQRWMLYNDDAANNNMTCAKLGLAPLNGTHRTGNYLQYKDMLNTDTDPLTADRINISVDPDAATFENDLNNLATFYENNFVLADPDTPMDNDGHGVGVDLLWRQRYYIWGLNRTALTANTWLTQTKLWKDTNSIDGTFDYQE
ncbi:RagB/SusD family nutrient uptake outer membrane protein [Bacteroides sp. RTP21281st1_E4_RTP21281_210402]|uniref:RagB/SusD family nutrient uptake outer membrane protein n=1 Tax=unclassified Bacteroides TaxID=2646097 RepID=UPI0034A1299C